MKAERNPDPKRQSAADQKDFLREVAAFEKFFAVAIAKMKRGQATTVILNVIEDPCKPKGGYMMSKRLNGPPDPQT
jgi:hypothetical protein